MIHYAVESVINERGFLSLVAEGHAAGFQVSGDAASDVIERLVETFQAEMWGGRVPAEDLLAAYEHACGARGHPIAPVSPADVALIRTRLDELTHQWSALPIGGSITLAL